MIVTVEVSTLALPWRTLASSLLAAGSASLPLILLAVLRSTDPPVTPPVLARAVFFFSLLPTLLAWLIQRAMSARATAEAGHLVISRRGLRIEIPAHAIVGTVPWVVPLPGVGLWLRLESGRRYRHGLKVFAPQALIDLLRDAGAPAAVSAPVDHPTFVYAAAKRMAGEWRWYHYAAKFVLFALLPAAVLFNAHQHIAYGGSLGQYYLEGLAPYLETLAIYWSTMSIYLVLYAAIWRGVAEGAALLTAWTSPRHAALARRAGETICRVAFYAGVPLLLLVRFLQ